MVDYAFYKYTADTAFMETYVSFYHRNFNYLAEGDHFRAEYELTANILQDDSLISQQTRRGQSIVNSLEDLDDNVQLLELFPLKIANESHEIKLALRDINSGKVGEYIFKVTPRIFEGDSLMLSDIELASSISPADKESIFNKNTLHVLPNPSSTFSINLPAIYYYAEAYNLRFNKRNPGEYTVRCNISDVNGNVVRTFPEKTYQKPGRSAVLVSGYNIVTLRGGIYNFNLEIQYQDSDQTIRRSKRFFFFKPGEDARVVQLPTTDKTSQYDQLSESELNQEFEIASYIATSQEEEIFRSLDAQGKRRFLAEFWRRRDSADTSQTSFRDEYFARVRLANQHFGTKKVAGWKTDRGRVFLTHGKPDEIERHASEFDKKPYEVWRYHNLEGGSIFVFVDISGFDEHVLIHSTYSKEVRNPNWERLLDETNMGISDF